MTQPLRTLSLLSVFCAGSGFAQDDPENEHPEETTILEHVIVTGSRIERIDYAGPAPVEIFSRVSIEQSGVNTLGEFFQDLPQSLSPVSELSQGSSFNGAAYVDLRGIGIDNTLTLLNGKRVAGYASNGASEPFVDVNAIPVAAIERVEILKDGASAIYGADAVAGVVNIILRDRFDGLMVDVGYLTTTEGDGDEWSANLIWGWNDDDTSVVATVSWFDKSPILARDREWTNEVDYSSLGGPNQRAFNSTPSTFFPVGSFQSFVDPECGVNPSVTEVIAHPFFGQFCGFNYAWFQQLSYDTQRLSANLTFKQEFSNQLGGRLDVFYSKRDNRAQLAPTPVFGGIIPAEHPNNPYGQPVELAGRPIDTGDRLFDTTADTYRVVAGLDGTAGRWDWSADLVFSGNSADTDRLNAVYADRYYAALAGMGGPNGNLYYNPFGAEPQNDPEVLNWMTTNTQYGADTTENALELETSTFFGNLPGGPIGFATGAQYRKQDLDEFADEAERSGQLAGGGQVTQISADRDIFAVYGELSLPLHSKLEAQVALRYDNYSDFGGTTNPKLGLAWRPSEAWLLRGTWSTSFRPPTFTELFNPPVINQGFYADVERCEITGAPVDCAFRQIPALSVGNEELEPEEGESIFIGMVWTPEFIEGLDIEIDYWRFEHTNRIVLLDPQLILDAKSNEGISRAPPTQEDIAIGAPGTILEVTQTYRNSDWLETDGFDFITRYTLPTETAGDFSFVLMYTHVSEYKLAEALVGSAESGVNFAGKYFNQQFGIPKNRANLNANWQKGKHSLAANFNYTGDYEGPFNEFQDGFFDTGTPWIVDDLLTFDLQYSYRFNEKGTELRIGCRNCTDEAPPVTFNYLGEGLYDYRGAIVYARLQYQF